MRSIVAFLFALLLSPPAAPPARVPAERPVSACGRNALIHVATRTFCPAGNRLLETDVDTFCLACHDGTAAAGICPTLESESQKRFLATWLGGEDHGEMHRTELPYPENRPGFLPAERARRAFYLPGGRLTCETCHPPVGSGWDRLMEAHEGAALCGKCHLR